MGGRGGLEDVKGQRGVRYNEAVMNTNQAACPWCV